MTPADGRRFGLTVGGAFLLLAVFFAWRGHDAAWIAAGGIGAALVVGGLALPHRMGPVHRAWMRIALAISKVTTPILMGVVFFLVVTPIGLAARALGHRPLRRRTGQSVWIERAPGHRKSDLTRQF